MSLAAASDNDLALNIQTGVSVNESLIELSVRHSGLYNKIVNSYFPSESYSMNYFNVEKDEVVRSKHRILYEAVQAFDFGKGTKVSTHIGNYTRFFCLHSIEKRGSRSIDPSICDSIKITNDGLTNESLVSNMDDSTIEVIKEVLKSLPDKRIWKVFKLRYFNGSDDIMTWRDMGPLIEDINGNVGVSYQTCLNLHNKGINEIRKRLKEV